MVHVPLYVSINLKEKWCRLVRAYTREVDWSVGEIMKVLRKMIWKYPIHFLQTMDHVFNNGDHAGSASPYGRQRHYVRWRMPQPPCPVAWHYSRKLRTQRTGHDYWFITNHRQAIGTHLPAQNWWERLCLITGEQNRHEAYYFDDGNQLQAARQGKWKSFPHVVKNDGRQTLWTEASRQITPGKNKPALFDLYSDISESKNANDKYPDYQSVKITRWKFNKELRKNKVSVGRI